ncbi:MAG: hypothetical protein LBO69_09060 [Ignavibacteria bacterium]|jgi:hypothetical protein|nr:hypothetical protein [Ignavibacteria bacterium]
MQNNPNMKCWVCGNEHFHKFKDGVSEVTSDDFKITDARYGTTMPLFQCEDCGFIQYKADVNIIQQYEQLQDEEYVASDAQRIKQFKHLINQVSGFTPPILTKKSHKSLILLGLRVYS